MFHTIIDFIHTQFATNSFFTGGALIGIIGGVATGALMYLKGVPGVLKRFFWRTFSCSLEISNHDPLYDDVRVWLDKQPYMKKARFLVSSKLSKQNDFGINETDSSIVLTPAPGFHFIKYKNKWIWFTLKRDDDTKDTSHSGRPAPPKERITFTMIGRSQKMVRGLVDDIVAEGKAAANKAFVYLLEDTYWSKKRSVTKRPIDSVILPEGMTDSLIKDINEFFKSESWYTKLGIPYRRGYLLHGINGTGKTSIISCIASELQLNLYVISLSSSNISDSTIGGILSDIKDNSIVLVEDIDAIFNGRDNVSRSQLSFSGLLNSLDGVSAREGVCVFMTTNHRENLDQALIRPGRIDLELFFSYADEYQTLNMLSRFYPESTDAERSKFYDSCKGKEYTTAQLQKHFQMYKSSIKDAQSNVEQMYIAQQDYIAPIEIEDGYHEGREEYECASSISNSKSRVKLIKGRTRF